MKAAQSRILVVSLALFSPIFFKEESETRIHQLDSESPIIFLLEGNLLCRLVQQRQMHIAGQCQSNYSANSLVARGKLLREIQEMSERVRVFDQVHDYRLLGVGAQDHGVSRAQRSSGQVLSPKRHQFRSVV